MRSRRLAHANSVQVLGWRPLAKSVGVCALRTSLLRPGAPIHAALCAAARNAWRRATPIVDGGWHHGAAARFIECLIARLLHGVQPARRPQLAASRESARPRAFRISCCHTAFYAQTLNVPRANINMSTAFMAIALRARSSSTTMRTTRSRVRRCSACWWLNRMHYWIDSMRQRRRPT